MEEIKNKIAIVGIDCRLPGANNSDEFWKNLVEEKETLVEFTDEELLAAGIEPSTFENPNYVRRRGIVRDAEKFDAEFFHFTPREAELLDPQHRLFIECAWHALEDAGIDPFNTDLKISVLGGTGSPYHLLDTIENESVLKYANGTSIITSNDKDYVTTRVSYKLNLKGPSINVQSACSTSMVAVVLGIDSLLNYQSDIVLAGGATIELPATKGYMYQEGSLESPDGKCRTFDKDAQGTVFSRGTGVVALKRLEDAIEDKDHIYSVILGGAINNDGNRKAGYTAPSIQGQVDVITEAIEFSGVDPLTITMVEAHGTATQVGDPIEVSSLSKAFSQYTDKKQYCALGSVKTNIGHTDVASGVASLIKVAMSLKSGIIPASLNYVESNPAIKFEDSPFYVNTRTKKWETENSMPRRALINSFGVGGTNACIVLEEPPQIISSDAKREYDTLLVSAHNRDSFNQYCSSIADYLEKESEINLNQLAYTSRIARRTMKYKTAIVFKGLEDLTESLKSQNPNKRITNEERDIVFMFPGQGNQYIDMGKELYNKNEVFRDIFDYCNKILIKSVNIDIKSILYPNESNKDNASHLIDNTNITQPAIFVISVAISNLLQHYGIIPDKLVGHSVGEYVAAVVSGIMSLEDALIAVATRGRLVYELPQGSMLAVLLSEEELLKILPKELCVAVINSPELVVVSGETKEIEKFAKILERDNIFNKLLSTSHAFHSNMMEPCLDDYRKHFSDVKLSPPKIPVVSTVTGKILTPELAQSSEYWINHVVDPVRFSDATSTLLESESNIFIECGPGQSLESAVKRRLNSETKNSVISTLNVSEDAVISFDSALGKLWIEEIFNDFDLRYEYYDYHKLKFPLLPFNRKPYIVEFEDKKLKNTQSENVKDSKISNWYYSPSWKKTSPLDFLKLNSKNLIEESLEEIWIVFIDSTTSLDLVNKIKLSYGKCFTVRAGTSYQEKEDEFIIRSDEESDYVKVFQSVNRDSIYIRVVYAWTLYDDKNAGSISLENNELMLNRNFYYPIYVEKSLVKNGITDNISLTFIANNSVSNQLDLSPEQALLIGPSKVFYKEHIDIVSKFISIDINKVNKNDALLDEIIKEIKIDSDETIIAYDSNNRRWIQEYENINIPEESKSLIVDNGIYLITGGTGGIGRILSARIAKTVKNPTIILTGRKELPDRKDWTSIISDENSSSSIKEKLQAIIDTENDGAKIVYFKSEVDNYENMKSVVETVETKYGRINGVFHSAGVAGGGVVASMTEEKMSLVINPKVKAVLILKEIFENRELEFIHLYSSVTAVLAEAGRVDYTSGNNFMDSVANTKGWLHKNAEICSINWGQWGIVGMAADWRLESKKQKNTYNEISHNAVNTPVTLEKYEISDRESCYLVKANADKHWIFNEHLLTGAPTMVGTSYVDTLLKWKNIVGIEQDIVLNDSKFLSPLMLMKNMNRELFLFINKNEENNFNFVFKSKSTDETSMNDNVWQSHFEGSIGFKKKQAVNNIDIEKLIKNSEKSDSNPHSLVIFGDKMRPLLEYSRRWDCKKTTYTLDNSWLTSISLREEFLDDFSYYEVHPAMLDVATSAHFSYMGVKNSYLPYSYGELKIYAPFEEDMFVLCKLNQGNIEDKFISFDFFITTKEGSVVLELNDYKFTKLEELSSKQDKINKEPEPDFTNALEDDILPEEGGLVLENLLKIRGLSQVVVYTKDLNRDVKESKRLHLVKLRNEKINKVATKTDIDDRPEIDTTYVEPENEIEKLIASIWTAILGINKIGINDTFNSLGGNSLLAIQVMSGIKDEFGIVINTDEFINNQTVFGLSELVLNMILEEHSEEDLESLLDE